MDHTLATSKGDIVFTQALLDTNHPPINLQRSSSLFMSNSSNIFIKAQKFELNCASIYYYTAKPNENVEIILNGQTDKFRCIMAENEELELFIDDPQQENCFLLPVKQFIIHCGTHAPLKLTLKEGKQYNWFNIHFSEEQVTSTCKQLHLDQTALIDGCQNNYIGPLTFTPATFRYLKSVIRPELFSTHARGMLIDMNILEIIMQQVYGKQSKLNKAISEKMKTADQFIQSNLQEKLSISDISKQVQMSESSFSNYFRLFFGIAPNAYINELKMHMAADLIRKKDLSLQQISASLGYLSEKGFRKSFVKHFGMLPKSYI